MRSTASQTHWYRVFTILTAFCLLLLPQAVQAEDDIAIILDGQQLVISDASPEIVDDRTFVPLRLISESMGIGVSYEESSNTVTIGEGMFQHVIGDSFVTMQDGTTVDVAVPSYIKEGRTMVSLRLFAEALECQVAWDDETRSVTLATPGGPIATDTLQTISNDRFGFILDIPSAWTAEDRSDNGDGFFIVCDEASMDIRVFGSNAPSVFGYEETVAELLAEGAKEFQFADGSTGYLMKDETLLEYILLTEEIQYTFSVDFTAAPAWFEANQELLESIAKSLRIAEAAFQPDEGNGGTLPVMPTFSISSEGIIDGEIAAVYGKHGDAFHSANDIVPSLSLPVHIEGAPEATVCYAIVLVDFTYPWVHWLAVNLDSDMLPANASLDMADEMVQGINDFGTIGYGGPTPPDAPHEYALFAMALDSELDLADGFSFEDLFQALGSDVAVDGLSMQEALDQLATHCLASYLIVASYPN